MNIYTQRLPIKNTKVGIFLDKIYSLCVQFSVYFIEDVGRTSHTVMITLYCPTTNQYVF